MTVFPAVFDLISMTNAQLVARGVSAHLITADREASTGHVRRLSPTWVASIGLWSVRTAHEIAEELDVTPRLLHSWAMFRHLRTRTRKFGRTQAQLAVLALGTPGSAREVGPRLGILPVEVCLYRSAADILRGELGVTFEEILGWNPEELEQEWSGLGLRVEFRPRTMNLSDPAEVDALVQEAEQTTTSEIDDRLAVFRRELPGIDLAEESVPASARSTLSATIREQLADIIDEAEGTLNATNRRADR